MASLEERMLMMEQEQSNLKEKNAELQKQIELLTVSIGALLVNKATLEQLKEQNGKTFDAPDRS